MTPLVSVIVAVHNGERFLEEALTSLLHQDYPNVEVIVVDDGSTDRSAEIARRLVDADRVLTQPQAGVSAARNAGLARAQGTFVAFLDDDDVLPPDKLSIQVGHLLRNPATDCVLGRQEIQFEPGSQQPAWMTRDSVYGDLDGIPLVSAVLKTESLRAVGGYDPSFLIAEDRDLFVRLREHGCVIDVLPEVVLHRRFHESNRSHQSTRNGHALLRSLRQKIDRERTDG